MALDDVFAGVERICDKYGSLSPREVAARWETIEKDGEVQQLRKSLSQRHNYATGILEGLMDELIFSFARVSGLDLNPGVDMRDIAFYCDNQHHPKKRRTTIATAVVPANGLDLKEMVIDPRSFVYTVYDPQLKGFKPLKDLLKNGKVSCPYCSTRTTKVITGASRVFVNGSKQEELIKKVKKALRKERVRKGASKIERELELLLHPNFRYQTYNQIFSGISPLSVLINNDVKGRAKQYPHVRDVILESGAPSVVAQGRMKFRRLAAKYMITKHIETDRDFLDVLGLRFKFPFVGYGYTMFNGVLPFLDNLEIDGNDTEDYIAKPKTDKCGRVTYRSIHTIAKILPSIVQGMPEQLSSLDGDLSIDLEEMAPFFDWKCLEIQGRTFEMDVAAMSDDYHQVASVRSRLTSDKLRTKYVIVSKLLDPRKIAPHLVV